jgi:pyrimidine deaminase RibD-like protein
MSWNKMDDERFMRLAIEQAKLCKPEDDRAHPKVGVVLVKEGKVMGTSYRGELAQGDHAEYTLLERRLRDTDLSGTTMYTTLEPCTTRSHDKIPCAQRISLRKVSRVVIGMLDPNPSISGKGFYQLSEAGIDVEISPQDLRNEIRAFNKDFIDTISEATQGKLDDKVQTMLTIFQDDINGIERELQQFDYNRIPILLTDAYDSAVSSGLILQLNSAQFRSLRNFFHFCKSFNERWHSLIGLPIAETSGGKSELQRLSKVILAQIAVVREAMQWKQP